MKILAIILFLPSLLFAQTIPREGDIYTDREQDHISDAKILQDSEIYLQDQALIRGGLSPEGYLLDSHYTLEDTFQLGVQVYGNADLQDMEDLITYRATFGYYWNQFWFLVYASQTHAEFGAITENHSEGDPNNADSEVFHIRPETQDQRLFSLGAGFGYRFRFLTHFLKFHNWFETTNVFLVYHNLRETGRNLSYNGYGLRTDYGLHYRISDNWHWGAMLSYNLASVVRDKLNEFDIREERGFILSWFSLGIDLTFYF